MIIAQCTVLAYVDSNGLLRFGTVKTVADGERQELEGRRGKNIRQVVGSICVKPRREFEICNCLVALEIM